MLSRKSLLRLPDDIQHRVDAGEVPARVGYELSKLDNDRQQRLLADQATRGSLTHEQATRLVRQRRGRFQNKSRHISLSFRTEHGWKVVVSAQQTGTYYEVEQALEEALAEVRHRIRNNVQLF